MAYYYQPENSDLSLTHLSQILGSSDFQPDDRYLRVQWFGRHILVILRYALHLSSSYGTASGHDGFSDRLKSLEHLARECCRTKRARIKIYPKFLTLMDSLMSELGDSFFAVPKALPGGYSWNEIIASFIHCLAEVLNELLEKQYSGSFDNIIVQREIKALWEKLKFLLAILGDKPFQCTQIEETNNILGEIESLANEAGIFLRSFVFTMDSVIHAEMNRALSALLPKFEVVEAKIREHCIAVPNWPIPNTSSPPVSMFIVDSVLDDLNHLINHSEPGFVVELKDQISQLYEELNYSGSFLIRDSIHHEMRQNKQLTTLVNQLIDLAFEVEYLVSWFVDGSLPSWYLALRIPSFVQKNKLISTELQEIEVYLGISHIEAFKSPPKQVSSAQVAKSDSMGDEIIVGFEDKTMEILTQLVLGPNNLQILSIIGMGGIGKSTLAKKLYNHFSIIHHFDRRSWCVVSQTYQKRKLLIDILRSITKISEDEASSMKEDALAERVYKNLKGNRYILVIDDVWDKEVWEGVKRYFPNDANGSRILFTSRNKDVADGIINELSLLSVEDCWDLLQRKLFHKGLCPSELVDIGKKIAESCKGLPLTVVGIVGVLANIPMNKSSWQEVASGLSLFISRNQDILELSYIHLPTRLKPCFLYLGVFEEDAQIPIRKLLYQWISQGFIPKKEGKNIEDVAEDFLKELINRSIVQVGKTRWDNEVETCKIHDLIRDMCLRIAREEKFLKVIKDEFSIYEQHQHLCCHSSLSHFKSIPFGLHVRSLLGYFSESFSLNASGFKLLRTLQTRAIDATRLKSLVRLRYLEAQAFKGSEMSHRNLEYLHVEGSLNPDVIQNMPKLRHVSFKYPEEVSSYWDISRISGLETLFGIVIRNRAVQELSKEFSRLRHLKYSYGIGCEIFSLNLSSFTQLETLNVTFGGSDWCKISFPNYIKKITLSRFFLLPAEILSLMGKLPALEFLKLSDSCLEKGLWNTDKDEFQNLKCLKLRNTEFRKWNLSAYHFPKLERLVLKDAQHPEALPSELGYIPNLRLLEVYGCDKCVRESAMQIQEEQAEDGNEVLKVIIEGDYNSRRWYVLPYLH